MSALQAVLSVIGGLVALATLGGALWVVARSSAQDATITRQRGEIADYLSRIEYIEPRLKVAEEQNSILRELQNPSAQLGRIEDNQTRMRDVLDEQRETLMEIEKRMPPRSSP